MKKASIPNDDNLLSTFEFKSIQVFLFYMGGEWLRYEVYQDGNLIFSGKDYRVGSSIDIDSLDAMTSLIGFVTLQKGDTDADYFKDYGKEQWAFTESPDADELRLLLYDYESGDKKYEARAKRQLKKYFSNDY